MGGEIDKARGVILGLAVGDALGASVEFMSLSRIRETYGPDGIRDFPKRPALFTDDTQMAVAVAEALVEAGAGPLDRLMEAVSARFVEWLGSPENYRAPGRTCISSVRRIEEGIHWSQSGDPGSKGCGAVMRTAPIGFFYQGDGKRLGEAALAVARTTHRHPDSDAATLAVTHLVKLALDGVPPEEWARRAEAVARPVSAGAANLLMKAEDCKDWDDPDRALSWLGEKWKGWTADEVAAQALFCVLRHPYDFEAAVCRAANTDGDSDSIACVAGAIAGARLGASAIPARWGRHVEKAAELGSLAERLAAAREALASPSE